ncbi:class I SAM-dependent methyltransferase [bacterium]|nr:class I SAM-dependent methyltransferase [bacterium]
MKANRQEELQNFDSYAEKYEELLNNAVSFAGEDGEYYAAYKIRKLKERLLHGRPDPQAILEFGCGTGKNLHYLRETFPKSKLYGTDISTDSLNIAQGLNLSNCEYQPFDGTTLPFPDEMFDLILVVNVFHHIPFELHDRTGAELRRVLKPGGELAIFEHNPHNPVTRKIVRDCPFDKDARLLKPAYTADYLKRLLGADAKFWHLIFVPPKLRPLLFIEKCLEWLPLGAQYAALAKKKKANSDR